jgi:hypothetical protein
MASETVLIDGKPVTFTARHFHISNWSTRVVFKCMQATLLEAGKERGRVHEVRGKFEGCPMAKKLGFQEVK